MRWRTLDEIVNSVLIQKGYPVHFYFQCVKYAADVLRELHFDTLRNIRKQELQKLEPWCPEEGCTTTIFRLPCDYVDVVKFGYATCRATPAHGIRTSLYCCDETGAYNADGGYWQYAGYFGSWVHNPDWYGPTHKIFKHEDKIEIYGSNPETFIMYYISDCSDADNASEVDPYAQACIEAYIMWKLKEHNRSYNLGEVREEERKFHEQRRVLRARKSNLTAENIKHSFLNKGRRRESEYY